MVDFSDFGKKLTGESGILTLMDDLGSPVPLGTKLYPLGGILSDGRSFEDLIGKYDGPQGRISFIDAVVDFFRTNYGWNIGRENVCVTNGSQSACFYLFNLLAGTSTSQKKSGRKKILLPLSPEYIGYADQGIEKDKPPCQSYRQRSYKRRS